MKNWRVQSDHLGRFDELVVGEHVHLEMMTDRDLWMRVGDHVININIKTGKAMHEIDPPYVDPKKRRRK